MNIPTVLIEAWGKWKVYCIGAGIILAVIAGIYLYGYQTGWNKNDQKWRSQIATAPTVVIKVDTVIKFVPQKPATGTSPAKPIVETPEYQAAADSIKKLNVSRDSLLVPQTTIIESERGKMTVTYYPAWKQFSYIDEPSPMKVEMVTVTTEKLVIQPESDWTIAGRYILGATVGGIITYVATHR